jgi:hypothetical protein
VIRAYVHEAFVTSPDTVAISLIREIDEPGYHERHILHLHGGEDGRFVSRSWDLFEPGGLDPVAPTLTLGREEAHVLANALISHFQGVDDQRLLRRDYDAERKRVDGLIDVLAEVVRGSSRG